MVLLLINNLIDSFNRVKNKGNLIHCITNPISINICANTILSTGNRPIMAEHPKEVYNITKSSNGLLLNLGNITDARMKSIKISSKAAKKESVPIVLDVVGISCSNLRKAYTKKLIKKYTPDVIKGNYSEIYALYKNEYCSKGVDSEIIDKEKITKVAINLSNKYNCVVLASGKTDIIASKENHTYINNGVEQLSHITGTGCILGSLIATFITEASSYAGTILACVVLGIAGEMAQIPDKNASFQAKLIDELSSFDTVEIKNKIKMEEKSNEEV